MGRRGMVLLKGNRVNLRFIDWIWHVRGSLPLPPEQSGSEAFDRLAPLFEERGTSHERDGDALTFRKKGQAPQDKMSVFDSGVLRIEQGEGGLMLRYHLISKALLACFLAPLLFLGIGQFIVAVGGMAKPPAEAEKKAEKSEKKDAEIKLHPIDQMLGAPEPEKPKKDGDKKDKEKGKDKKPSPTPAYVFAGIFAALYLIGRILEDRLVRRLFNRRLLG